MCERENERGRERQRIAERKLQPGAVGGHSRGVPLLQAGDCLGAWLGRGRGGESGQDSVATGSPSYSLDDFVNVKSLRGVG